MVTSKTVRLGLAILASILTACNGSNTAAPVPVTTQAGTPSISILAPYDQSGDAYFVAGTSVYSTALNPTDGVAIKLVGTVTTNPASTISFVKPFGNVGGAYVAAGTALYSVSKGFSTPFDSVPAGTNISQVEPYGTSGDVYVAAGSVLYASSNGSSFFKVGTTIDGAPITQILPFDGNGNAYVSAGKYIYTTNSLSLNKLDSTLDSSIITQMLLIGPSGSTKAYVAAGSSLYSTNQTPLTLIDSTKSVGGSSSAAPAILELQAVGVSSNAFIAAGTSLFHTDGIAVKYVDTLNLPAGFPAVTQIQLIDENGMAYLAAGSSLYLTNGTKTTSVGTAQNSTVITRLQVFDPTADAYAAAGSDLYSYVNGVWKRVGNIEADGTPSYTPITSQPSNPTAPNPTPTATPSTPCIASASSHVVEETVGTYAANARGSLKKLTSHIPHAALRMKDQGKIDETQSLSITLSLPLNNQADLEQKLIDLYNPNSASYHHFLTPDQFRAKYAPTQDQVNAVKKYLAAQGMSSLSVNDNRTLVSTNARLSAINSTFHTEIHRYQDTDGSAYYAPAYELQVDSSLPVQAVIGLESISHPVKQLHPSRARANTSVDPSTIGLIPSQIAAAYNIPGGLTGAGQTLAVFELDGYTASDITAFENYFSIPAVPLQNVLVDGAKGTAGSDADETTLDLDMMLALAPGAAAIRVYEAPKTNAGILANYDKIASDNLAQEISTSWGLSNATAAFAASENTAFQQMSAQGQSIFSASGDNGAYADGTTVSVSDPATQPYVVGVGGTTLTTSSSGSYVSETTWNAGSISNGASGGGVSTVWSIPTWQVGFISAATKGSTTMRNIPDVSLNADPNTGYAIYYQGTWQGYGGTSAAAPLWAAFTALVNQQRLANGMSLLGFPNPSLYAIGAGNNYLYDFHDIADGRTNLFFPAVTGYDNATGLGSFSGANLFNDLTQNNLGITGCSD